MKPWYLKLFENYAENYDREEFTKGTAGEVDFIEREIGADRSRTILDVGCGTGRHAVELAKRGYDVTAFDISEAQLRKAGSKAEAAGVRVRFIRSDARSFRFRRRFDLALMICEGAFPLMETDEENVRILENAARALKPGGKLILTTLNALFPLAHSIKDFMNAHGQKSEANSFDLMTFRDRSVLEFTDDNGDVHRIECNERYYAPSEISWLLRSLGFVRVDIFGCRLGAFSRDDTLTPDDFEMLVVAEKAAG